MVRVIPEKHTSSCMPFWDDSHHVCLSGMTLIMYAFLERPSSCMLFWNDLHQVCFSAMTLIMYAFLESLSSCMLFWKDPHHVCFSGTRKAYMMRVVPEKHA
jgi:ribosomal protein L32